MSYFIKYKLSFVSDRDNDYELHILQKNYGGQPIVKKLGIAPTLSIEEGDGSIKGSSLSFSIQADVEGELRGLYTTDNKEFKVLLYRNSSLYWQGFLLPELYSEEYVDAPYDVSVTATDGLATLKAITYEKQDVNVSLAAIIEDILSYTQVSLPVTYHMSIAHAFEKYSVENGQLMPGMGIPIPMLVNTEISQAAYNGYTCYDVLNQILQSCNCCIMQIGGEWLVSSLTDAANNYYTAGSIYQRDHKILGQLGVAEIYPSGTLTLVNSPALKGANVEYSHMMRKSFLKNADCIDRQSWNYEEDYRNPIDIPGEKEAFGKIFKVYCFELHPKNISKDSTLQLWQQVYLNDDADNFFELEFKYLFSTNAKLLLLSLTHYGDDGVIRHLTGEGWVDTWSEMDVNSYIQVTGQSKGAVESDFEQYEVSKVQFSLPGVGGYLKVGFINSTLNYADPFAYAPIYVTQVYLTVGGISGQQCTTEVEPNATQEQPGVLLVYGDTFESVNAYKLETNTLKNLSGENIASWWLNGKNYTSYYDVMLQEYSRYFGTKKVQLQGAIMGEDVLHNIYEDSHSGIKMRLVTAQMDLLSDEASVTLEEIVSNDVEFTAVVYATNNTNSFGTPSSGGGGTVSGGSSSSVDTSHLLGREEAANTYATKTAVADLGNEVAEVREDLDALNDLLNDDVAGVINTWDEVVDFLNEYSESQDLASILSQMNADIANRVLYEDFEKLEEAVSPLFGYFDANGNANNALKLGGHSADYFATADALNTHITAFNNYKTTTDNRLNKLEALWYMDDDGNVHTTHNIIVEGGGAFGKGSGGGGDVPSGGGIDEAQLWNILGQSGTQTIHSSHIPDLSGKYLSVSGGTISATGSINGILNINDKNPVGWGIIRLFRQGVAMSAIGADAQNGGFWIQNSQEGSNQKLFSVKTNGLYYGSDTLIHSGNIGSYAPVYNSNGNVLIGTIEDSGYKLAVNGSLNATTIYQNGQTLDKYYLSLSGGTIDGALKVNGNFFTDNVRFNREGVTQILAAYAGLNYDLSYYDGSTWERVLTSKNYSSYALPLSGGTIDGTLNIYDTVNRSTIKLVSQTNQPNDLWFGANGAEHWSLTSRNSPESYLFALFASNTDGGVGSYVYTANLQTGVVDFKYQPTVNGNAVIHSGNIADQAVFRTKWIETLSADSTTWYGNLYRLFAQWKGSIVDLKINDTSHYDVRVDRAKQLDTARTIWGQSFDGTGNVSGNIKANASILQDLAGSTLAWGSSCHGLCVTGRGVSGWVAEFGDGTNSILIGCRGGNYDFPSIGTLNAKSFSLAPDGGNVLIGTTDDNGSGAKLQVAGSTYISGKHLNIGKSITAYSSLRTEISLINDNTEPSMMILGSNGVKTWGIEGRGSNENYRFGIYSWLDSVHVLGIATNGNVTISSNSVVDQGYKLYVDGITYVNGTIYTSDWLYTYNSSGWYNATYNGGIYMSDSVYLRAYNDKVFYTKGFIAGHGWKDSVRSTMSLVNPTDNPVDFWLGTAGFDTWSINVRGSGEDYYLGFYTPNFGQVLTLHRDGGAQFNRHLNVSSNLTVAETIDGAIFTSSSALTSGANTTGFFRWGRFDENGGLKLQFGAASGTKFEIINSAWNKALFTLTTEGNLAVTGGGAFGSDIRYKDITSYRQIDLETIVNAPLFSFKWTDREDKATHLGTSAQYWLGTQAKDAVNITNPKFFHLDYGALAVGIGISVAREVKVVKTEVQILKEELSQVKKELKYYKELWQHSAQA